jgi:putative tryptophan/tyrosine transport system substrate-binding protein
MRRREFITLLGGAAVVWPLAARAQQKEGTPYIGVLLGLADGHPETQSRVKALQKGLRDLGWLEGQNIRADYRFASSDPNRAREYAAELVRLKPDVIVANSTPVLTALRQATSTIPIVMAVVNDPVGQGFISSAAHPGGNVTGFSFIEPDLIGKWLTMLKHVAPKISRANLMFNPATAPYYDVYLRSFEAVRQSTKVDVIALAVRQTVDIQSAIAKLARDPSNGLIAASDAFIVDNIQLIAQLTLQQRMPAISPYQQFVAEGGLISYGPDPADIFRRAAGYVDRILKGTKPVDLPLQSPDRFELAINLKTAKVLGLEPPPTLVAIADEVIE